MKNCTNCGEVKTLDKFHKSTKYTSGVQLWCIACANMHGAYRMRKKWAKKDGIPFELNFKEYYALRKQSNNCPITGESFREPGNGNGGDSATLDKINPKLGYTLGNVAFISRRANSIKNNLSSSDEARKIFENVIKYMKNHGI